MSSQRVFAVRVRGSHRRTDGLACGGVFGTERVVLASLQKRSRCWWPGRSKSRDSVWAVLSAELVVVGRSYPQIVPHVSRTESEAVGVGTVDGGPVVLVSRALPQPVSTTGVALTPSSSLRVAVSVVPAAGVSDENVIVPSSSWSVTVTVTA